MTLLELIVLQYRCRSTHQFVIMDALQRLDGPDREIRKGLLLRHHKPLLKGATAPDTRFRDYRNHVLHVEEGEWGGARDAAMKWYGKAVDGLRQGKWSRAAYALGVLTHYYVDPIHPFHTAQSEEDCAIHRALERSIVSSRPTLKALIDARGYPKVEGGDHTGFVADMVLAGAKYANPHYQTLIDHYDLEKAIENPEAALDDTLLTLLADLMAYATSGVAVLFDRAFKEAKISAPEVDLDVPGYLAALDIPVRKLARRLRDAKDRWAVSNMYAELQTSGKVIRTLSADDRVIRRLHAEEVLRMPLTVLDAQPLEPLGTHHVNRGPQDPPVRYVLKVLPEPVLTNQFRPETGAHEKIDAFAAGVEQPDPEIFEDLPQPGDLETMTPDLSQKQTPAATHTRKKTDHNRLTADSPIIDAPSIGPKTAARLQGVNIATIGDLLTADPDQTAAALNVRYIKAATLTDWQDQTRLMLEAPGLRVLDSQILVGAGIRTADGLARSSVRKVLDATTSFLSSPGGAKVLWGGDSKVNENDVKQWIDYARSNQG